MPETCWPLVWWARKAKLLRQTAILKASGMATERLTSDLREAISKISEVGRLLAPLTSNTSVNRPGTGANSEVSESQSAAPPTTINHELQRLFPTLRNTNAHDHGQAAAFRSTQVAARGGKRRRQTPRVNESSKRAKKPVCKDIVLIPNPKQDKVPTHNARVELERKGFVIHEFPFEKEWNATMLRRKIEEQFPQLEWRLFEYMKVRITFIANKLNSKLS